MKSFLKILVAFVFVTAFFAADAWAQTPDASSGSGKTNEGIDKKDLPEGIKETLVKYRIKEAEKQYQELVERGEEAAKLGEELNKSLETNQKLSDEDFKKLDRMEKLVKKIRSDLGAQNDDTGEDSSGEKPLDPKSAAKNIRENSATLAAEIKKIGRYTISVGAVENSNALLRLIQFLRFNKN